MAKKTPAPPKFTPEQIAAALDAAARVDFRVFCRLMHLDIYGEAFNEAPFHDLLFDQWEGIFAGKILRAIQVLPPRSGKSFIACCATAFGLLRSRNSLYIVGSYAEPIALLSAALIQQIIRSPTFQRLAVQPVEIDPKASALDKFSTLDGAGFRAVGQGGSVTGFGAGRWRPGVEGPEAFGGFLLVDDILKISEGRSQAQRDVAFEYLSATLLSRKNSALTPVILTGQRAHGDDPIGRVLDGRLGQGWNVVHVRGLDPVTDESYWPARRPAEEMREIRETQPLTFYTQIQGEPSDPQGQVFKTDRIALLPSAPTFAGPVRYCRAWDFAGTAGKGDATVSVLMACDGDRVTVLDLTQDRITWDDVKARVLSCAKSDPAGTLISVPNDPSASGKAVFRELVKILRGHDVREGNTRNSKYERALPFSAAVNGYMVSVVEHRLREIWQSELQGFDNAKHDDFVDASADAFAQLSDLLGTDKDLAEREAARKAALEWKALAGDQAAKTELIEQSDNPLLRQQAEMAADLARIAEAQAAEAAAVWEAGRAERERIEAAHRARYNDHVAAFEIERNEREAKATETATGLITWARTLGVLLSVRDGQPRIGLDDDAPAQVRQRAQANVITVRAQAKQHTGALQLWDRLQQGIREPVPAYVPTMDNPPLDTLADRMRERGDVRSITPADNQSTIAQRMGLRDIPAPGPKSPMGNPLEGVDPARTKAAVFEHFARSRI
jgi:predicted phage terminase large subunit-like protein